MTKKIIISLATWFLSQVIVLFIASAITGNQNIAMIASLSGGAIITIITLALIKYYKPSELITPVPFKVWIASIPLVFCTLFAIDILSSCVDIPDLLGDEFDIISSSIIGILAITILGPVQEEIIMRRIIMKSIYDKKKNVWLAIVVSALLFAIIHGNPIQIVFAFPAGLLLGWLYYRTGSLLIPITGHIVNNSFSCIDLNFKLTEGIYGAQATLTQANVFITFVSCIIIAIALIFWLINYCKKNPEFLPLQPESTEQELQADASEMIESSNK